jgi:hypothetical protein
MERFLEVANSKPYEIKIAAYKKSSPATNINWTLDCLLGNNKGAYEVNSEYFEVYFNHIKLYKPDLIISDLEYFSSYVGEQLGIPVWQCSSSLVNSSFNKGESHGVGLFKKFNHHLSDRYFSNLVKMTNSSKKNLVYSHAGDICNLQLKNSCTWVRPYHILGKKSKIYSHNIVGYMPTENNNIISLLNRYNDTVLFTEDGNEKYSNIIVKSFNNSDYANNLYNSNLFICGGQTNLMADAYYNGKYCITMIDFDELDCVMNCIWTEHLKMSKVLYQPTENITKYINYAIIPNYNTNIKYLHEIIDNYIS